MCPGHGGRVSLFLSCVCCWDEGGLRVTSGAEALAGVVQWFNSQSGHVPGVWAGTQFVAV